MDATAVASNTLMKKYGLMNPRVVHLKEVFLTLFDFAVDYPNPQKIIVLITTNHKVKFSINI